MNRIGPITLLLSLSGCSSEVTLAESDALSSAKVARTPQCDAPLLVSRAPEEEGRGLLYTWACKPEADGSRRTLEVIVSTTGDIELRSMTVSPDDPVFGDIQIRKAEKHEQPRD